MIMTEDETFRRLKRVSYAELEHNHERFDLPGLIEYVESNHWTWIEYLETVYVDPKFDADGTKEEFMAYWMQEYNRIK